METNHTTIQRLTLAVLLMINLPPASAFAQGTAFTYQGRLNDSGNPANGTYDLRFTVWDASTNGTLVAGPLTNAAMGITNGCFTVTLDFGSGVFSGPDRWLQLDARTNGADAFTTLYPFQQLLPMPYAIMANSASNLLGTLPVSQLNGTIPLAQLPGAVLTNNGDRVVLSGVFSGDGSGLTNLLAGNLSGIFRGNVIGSASTATNFNGPLAGDVTGTQSATVVASVGGQSAANLASGVSAANGATSAAVPDTIVSRDAAGSFAGTSLTLNGNLSLPATTDNGGVIYLDGGPFIHGYGNDNVFAGSGAGNLTMTGTGCNTGIGYHALQQNTSGSFNAVVGAFALPENTTGFGNAAVGSFALQYNTTGSANTAIGDDALAFNTGGFDNTAIGSGALEGATGSYNVALGVYAGGSIGSGNSNIDIGNAGYSTDTNIIRIGQGQTQTYIAGVIHGDGSGLMNVNVSTNFKNIYLPAVTSDSGIIYSGGNAVLNLIGYENLFVGAGAGNFSFQPWPWPGDNTALGCQALHNGSNGWYNTAVGALALYNNLDGGWNVANGYQSLYSNLTGTGNIAIGVGTLFSMTNGAANTAIGNQALYSATFGTNNTAVGTGALSSMINGTNNIALGYRAGAKVEYGANNIHIGNQGNAYDEGVIRIGDGQSATYLAGVIYGCGWGLSNLSGTFTGNVTGSASSATNFSGLLTGDVTGPQGATVVASVGGQSAASVAAGVSAVNAATGANTPDTIVFRDSSGNFNGGTLTLDGNLWLPATTTNAGIIYSGGIPLVYAYGNMNFFAGASAGNLTMIGPPPWYGYNTGLGAQTMQNNASGICNTASGALALQNNASGAGNTASGAWSLQANTAGSGNTAYGYSALQNSADGDGNIAVGRFALANTVHADMNIALGDYAGYSILAGGSNIDIGNTGQSQDTNIIRIGDQQTQTYIAGVINGNGAGLTNIPPAALSGGLTTNIAVLVPGGGTNTLCFTNGILTAVQ